MKLSSRLQCIANLIETCEAAADIGTDHAYLPIYLIHSQICKKVIACDVRNEPVKKAQRNVRKAGLADKIEVRLGNGLEVVKESEAESIIISGMGGTQITRILEGGQAIIRTFQSLILQPMTQHFELRNWLKNNNYEIVDEDLCKEDGRIYLILKVDCKTKNQDGINIYFGNILFKKRHPLLAEYIKKYIKEFEDVKLELLSTNSAKLNKTLKEIEQKIELFNNFLNQV
ncbi:MAG: tRNA (adenine(22)-N(1))-methyltransferase [Deltaproteobacteria bacterium]